MYANIRRVTNKASSLSFRNASVTCWGLHPILRIWVHKHYELDRPFERPECLVLQYLNSYYHPESSFDHDTSLLLQRDANTVPNDSTRRLFHNFALMPLWLSLRHSRMLKRSPVAVRRCRALINSTIQRAAEILPTYDSRL